MNRIKIFSFIICATIVLIGYGSAIDFSKNLDTPTTSQVATEDITTGSGSIFVNGVEYKTDDNPKTSESDFDVSMGASEKGSVIAADTSERKLKDIPGNTSIQDILQNINLPLNSQQSLSQTNPTNNLSALENLSIESLTLENILSISRLINTDGTAKQ